MTEKVETTKFVDSIYYHTSRASDLKGFDRFLYRFFEMIPGLLSWGTLIGVILLSLYAPVYAAIFVIAFDAYWLLKTIYMSTHLRYNWKRLKYNLKVDWSEKIKGIPHDHIMHMIILPFYKEPYEVVSECLKALSQTRYDLKKMSVVLAGEERAWDTAKEIAGQAEKEFGDKFGNFIVTVHPANISGEQAGKGSNISYAAEQSRIRILDKNNIPYEDVIVSAFDIDTVAYPDYFSCVTYNFITHPNRHKASFQPVPLYNNNIWQAPVISRVVATSSTFWQMIQQERPEKLATFSSHAVSFKALVEGKYWQRNMVSEDSRIYWNLFLANDGDYEVVPISYPVSMDANIADSYWKTMKNVYRQHRRWGWGVENVPYILMGFVKNKNIPFGKKFWLSFVQIEGFWSLATNPLMIFFLGWAPLVFGNFDFSTTVLSYSLPRITKYLMNFAMLGLVLSAIISFSLLPPPPPKYNNWRHKSVMIIQWILVPFTIIIFGAIPGLDAQTRLMIGKYMGFWVTPKKR